MHLRIVNEIDKLNIHMSIKNINNGSWMINPAASHSC